MRNMMAALLQLEGVRKDHVARDGLTINIRLKEASENAARDIKECANACDAYSRKRLLVKVFKAPSWNGTLKEYIQRFNDRKGEFNFAISIHTGIGIDNANDKLDVLLTKIDVVLEFFEKVVPREQQTLADSIRQGGGTQAVLGNPILLQELLRKEQMLEGGLSPTSDPPTAPRVPAPTRPGLFTVYPTGSAFVPPYTGPTPTGYPGQSSGDATYLPTPVIPSYQEPPVIPAYPGPHVIPPYIGPAIDTAPRDMYSGYYYYPRAAEHQRSRVRSVPPRDPHTTYATPYYEESTWRPDDALPPANDIASAYGPLHTTAYAAGSRPSPVAPTSNPWADPREEENPFLPVSEPNRELDQLMADLADEPAVAIRKNLETFEHRFLIQQQETVAQLTDVIVHEGDRVISTVLDGPHEKIIDPVMYEIWKDMRWRGIVKARHLVLAIHDYYTQRLDDQQRALDRRSQQQLAISENELWALEYIDLMHLHHISEALDSDSSGFVTIQEVNRFTVSRPRGWSLLRWFAYWAVGWQASMTEYRRKIWALLTLMNQAQPLVRVRRDAVWSYLSTVTSLVQTMTDNFREDTQLHRVDRHFQEYTAQEEAHISKGLQTAKYDLDALDTLALISGPRWGLERSLFVILYLLLRRHYDVMRLAQTIILHRDELSDAAATITLVQDAFNYRVQHITVLLAQRRLNVHLELGDFACGMLSPSLTKYFGLAYTQRIAAESHGIDETTRTPPQATTLKYPPHFENFYPESDDGVESDGTDIIEDLRPLLGYWVASRTHEADEMLHRDVFTFTFHISPTDSSKVVAISRLLRSRLCTLQTMTGEVSEVTDCGQRTYLITTTCNSGAVAPIYFKATLDADGTTLAGEQDTSAAFTTPGHKPYVVCKKGVSPETMLFYPTPSALATNKPAALWRFALDSVLYDVRRRLCSWNFLQERRDRKRRLVSLLHAVISKRTALPSDDAAECTRLFGLATPADLHFYAHAALEPDRFPWLLRPCLACGRGTQYHTALSDTHSEATRSTKLPRGP
ncbi:hypothetical protein TRAPUB_2475 [Trametes pubescens]|uniref:EF-hand domain-containing protein n=1 Tax=Trametes pubescens TaxID=154538 RepID=A0A1M2VGF6_TRAPU|nr:hypothetical protein TRAPUB_2475 [Trametes pubescens]